MRKVDNKYSIYVSQLLFIHQNTKTPLNVAYYKEKGVKAERVNYTFQIEYKSHIV